MQVSHRSYRRRFLVRYPARLPGSTHRGTVLSVSIGSDDARKNAIIYDENRLLALFQTQLRFKFCQQSNLTAKDLQKLMLKLATDDHQLSASFLCFVSAHGFSDEETRKDYIACMDPENPATESASKKFISVENVTQPIANCPTLKGKPKIFFFQTCRCLRRGLRDRAVRTPARRPEPTNQKLGADLLEVFATSRGDAAYKHNKGTVFIQNLCEYIETRMRTHHLRDILDELALHFNEEPILTKPDGTEVYQTMEVRGNLPKKMHFYDEE